ncbi:MAG: exopolyphosphatase [Desulfobacterales bacterium]|nr:exopolyphosphatase [Desulfobacterales bacterium]
MRLLTRPDFDGLICAALLTEIGIVDEYKFVHPKVIQDGMLKVKASDVLANMPYAPGCGLWFDHHASEQQRLNINTLNFKGDSRPAPSTTQIIWDYYGGEKKFGKHFLPLIKATNKFDAAILTHEEILKPTGWILIAFLMDPRTGLGRFTDYRISNTQFTEDMIQYLRTKTEQEILQIPDVKEREQRYHEQQELFRQMLERCCETRGNIIINNLLNEETISSGNRFLVYVLHPDQNIEIRMMWGPRKQKVVFTCGHSILNRTSRTNVGNLMLKYGGGGHLRVGSCQVPADKWEQILEELVEQIHKDG